jgi:TetR/AcrR family transcriptional regulator, transcriptional repressor for nem operon
MRYRQGYKDEKRKELLKAAGGAAKRDGFAASGVDALAKAAGVTSGALYAHFSSKAGFLAALITQEMEKSRVRWARRPERTPATWRIEEAARYLSLAHIENPETGCILPTLAADISHAELATRQLFGEELRKAHQEIAERLGDQREAWTFLAQIVGAMVLARAVTDEEMQGEILGAVREGMDSDERAGE